MRNVIDTLNDIEADIQRAIAYGEDHSLISAIGAIDELRAFLKSTFTELEDE